MRCGHIRIHPGLHMRMNPFEELVRSEGTSACANTGADEVSDVGWSKVNRGTSVGIEPSLRVKRMRRHVLTRRMFVPSC